MKNSIRQSALALAFLLFATSIVNALPTDHSSTASPSSPQAKRYEPNWESLDRRPTPEKYQQQGYSRSHEIKR